MNLELGNRVVFVTGGAHGIGQAICRRVAQERPSGIVIADRDLEGARTLAVEMGGLAVECDVSVEADVQSAVALARQAFGRIDVVISNAGVTAKGGIETPDADWDRLWRVNVLAHVYLARAVVPTMIEQADGAFVVTASAAGLLTEIGSAAYSVTKHGAVAFAEWLSVQYRDRGLKVACLCPAGVATGFLDLDDPVHQFLHATSVTPEQVADCVIDTLKRETFLALPHAVVGEFFQFKSQNYDRWLHNFAHINTRLQRKSARARSNRGSATPAQPE